jgi:hypothetical protein
MWTISCLDQKLSFLHSLLLHEVGLSSLNDNNDDDDGDDNNNNDGSEIYIWMHIVRSFSMLFTKVLVPSLQSHKSC